MSTSTLRIGLLLGSKQAQWQPAMRLQAREWGDHHGVAVEIDGVDFHRALEDQKFDCVLHKMCSHFALADTDPAKARELRIMADYFDKHPEVSFDPLTALRDVNDRNIVCQKLTGIDIACNGQRVVQPPFYAVASQADVEAVSSAITFALPWICKPFVADGVPASHDLSLVMRSEGLRDAQLPFILQPFINHDAQIIKIYVLGDTIVQLRRPSLPNLRAGPSNEGPALAPFGRISNAGGDKECKVLPADERAVPAMDEELLRRTVAELRSRLDIQLFGVDFVRDMATGDYAIIDINYLPGYYGVPNVFEQLLDLIWAKVQRNRR